ncbi:SAM-dependent methyltransferase [Vibrio inusitatus NBRC 102082]|uniref:SAM-dependent methyltransferase n=1 Tax=Vibrio inusitatus NBRC 102082 TaxID=1219070 RepID=A0A4Y3HUU4_9VIBR|nr:class I SAM-dependent methyltransferase [Vibrio inusitatus]GEA50751.1 SAM-dependent methyltransferase [Vibrio inusitatus NBRC 102082]
MSNPIYTKFADKYACVVRNNIYNALLERPSILALIDVQPNQKVLDLGCGSGEHAKEIQAKGGIVTCVDLSEEMVELTQANAKPFHAYVQDLSMGLPCEEEGVYDWVIAPLVIHYLEDLTALFKEVKRVLKPGGQLLFSTHHPINDFQASPSGHYFAIERITEEWDTIGEPVEVSFFRRSLQDLFGSIFAADLLVSAVSEGSPSPAIADISPETYEKLCENPSFIYIRCVS